MAKAKRSPGPKRAAITARCCERRLLALEFRKKCYTYDQIAAEIKTTPLGYPGYNRAAAHRDVQEELGHIAEQTKEAVESVREIELMRLDRLAKALEVGIEAGDPQSINSALKIGESRRKLMGLDAPDKVAQTNVDGTKEALPSVIEVVFVKPEAHG